MQARVALEEGIKRWPEWDIDYANRRQSAHEQCAGLGETPGHHGVMSAGVRQPVACRLGSARRWRGGL